MSTPAGHIEVPCLALHPARSLPFWRNWVLSPGTTPATYAPTSSAYQPRSRRGRWYSLVGPLLVCACAVVSSARTITEITEWGQCATTTPLGHLGIRRHLPGHRRAPSHATLTRPLAALDGDALRKTRLGAGRPWPGAAGRVLRGGRAEPTRHLRAPGCVIPAIERGADWPSSEIERSIHISVR
ncbi:transposase family protein [Streptomyces sp. NPDC008061]|uniref:transposase family protein n=1 Tax=Streptomyces sp. NPDC008061 TaxID=3364805 RepID=UPI0036E38B72